MAALATDRPTRLYHGTTEAVARDALAQGLHPRSYKRRRGNWAVASHPDMVYLTQVYAGYFASMTGAPTWGIVEVDLDKLDPANLYPDEDFIEQATRGQVVPDMPAQAARDMKGRVRWFRENIERYAPNWLTSLTALGNLAHRGPVPAEAVTRVATFRPATNETVSFALIDPLVSTMNFKLFADQYRHLTRWLMGDAYDVSQMVAAWPILNPEQRKQAERVYADRSGCETIARTA